MSVEPPEMGLAATSHLGYCFEGLDLNLNSLFILRDTRLSAAPAVVARFATALSRQSAVLISEAIH
jgi:hypothetical protein